LAQWVADLLDLPVALGNDADVAGLAEALFGAGQGLSPVFYITVGSGIGGGLILNGEIHRGCGRGAAEIGHLKMEGREWGTDRFVSKPLEEWASGWAIEQAARAAVQRSAAAGRGLLALAGGDAAAITSRHVGQAAEQGDTLAQEVLAEAVGFLARGICHVIALLCPRGIVIGGGVSLLGEPLFQPLRQRVKETVFMPFRDCYDIVPAVLGEAVVVHGALALARKRLLS
jgi:glucokinase